MKLEEISGTNKGISETKFDETEAKSKIKNIRDLYRGIIDFKKDNNDDDDDDDDNDNNNNNNNNN